MACHGEGGAHATSLERPGWIQALVLNQKVLIFATGQHGSHALAQGHRLGVWEHGRITPHTRRAVAERFTRRILTKRRQVVTDEQRTAVFGTDIASDIGSHPIATLAA